MPLPDTFWQKAKLAAQLSPGDEGLRRVLALAGQNAASPTDISSMDSQPTAPVEATPGGDGDSGGGPSRSPAGIMSSIKDWLSGPTPAPSPGPAAAPAPVAAAAQAAKKIKTAKKVTPAAAPAAAASAGQSNQFDLNNPYPGMLRGHFLDQQHEDQLKNSDQQSRVFFMDPEVQKARMEQLASIPQFANLIQGNQNFKDALAMEARRPTPADLSGAMGMADILSNGKYNLRGGYKAPNTEGRTKDLLTDMDKAQDNDRQTTQALTQLANSGKAGNDIMTAATMLMNKDSAGFKDVAKKVAAMGGNGAIGNNLKFDSENEKIMKPYRDAQESIDKSMGLLDNGASVSDVAATLQFVKPMVSRLTNFEWSKLGRGATDAESRFKQALSTLDTGTLDEGNRGQYKQALQTMREINDAIAEKAMEDRTKIGTAAGLNGGFAGTSSRGHYQSGGKKPAPAAPARTKPLDQMTQAELDAYEKSLTGGK